jgi:hypothetical protein
MSVKKNPRRKPVSLKETLKVELQKALPQVIALASDLLEKKPPRMTNKDKRVLSEELDKYLDNCVPLIEDLEALEGKPDQLSTAYDKCEALVRTWLTGMPVKIKSGEDAFDSYLRVLGAAVRMPSAAKRVSQLRRVRNGVEHLVGQLLSKPETELEAGQLIDEFERKHGRQHIRYLHGLEVRQRSYRNLSFKLMTSKNISALIEEYRDSAAAFEKRLRLLVGLNHIAEDTPKTYAELRQQSLFVLLQTVDSPNNPSLHFLRDAVDRRVRNALAHDGASPAFSKGVITFIDYSPKKGETELVWTMSQFIRSTSRLVQTVCAANCLEQLFSYARLSNSIARFRYAVELSKAPSALTLTGKPPESD